MPSVPGHLCRGARALCRVRRGHIISHDHFATPRRQRCPRSCRQPTCDRDRPSLLRRGGHDARVLSARNGVRTERGDAGGRANAGSAARVRAVVRRAAEGAARPVGRRRESPHRQIQRFPMPAVPPVAPGLYARHRKVRSGAPWRGTLCAQGLSAELRL